MLFRMTLAAMLAATPALAQDKPAAEPPKPVTRTEISDRLEKDYADLDGDKDGKVMPAEINARLLKSAQALIEVAKKDRDETFAKLDTNSDGSVSRAEFEAGVKLPAIKDPDPKPFLDRFDANKDGAITKDEFRKPTLANFDRLDRNKDGNLTPAEQQAPTPPARKTKVQQTPPIGR